MNILNLKNIAPILILIIVITGLNIFAPGEPAPFQCFFASLILVMGFIPTFLYIEKNEHGIPFLPLFGVIYSVYYALPVFTLKEYRIVSYSVSGDSLARALLLAAIGLFMLLFAYYKIPGKSAARLVPKISIYWNIQKAMFWAIILGIIGLVFSYLQLIVNIPAQFAQIALFLSELLIISIGILFILEMQRRLHKTGKILLWMVFLPSIFLLRIGSGSIAQVLLVVIFLSLTYWYFRRKIPWKTAVVMALLLIFFSSIKTEFRNLTWKGAYTSKNPVEKSILFTNMAFTKREAFTKGCIIAANRTAHNLLTFAYVADATPKTVPYWMGKSYCALLWAPVPRIIFPWKPSMILGQEFGHCYGFLHPSDHSTSWNLPQTVEMYVNFGVIGVIIGMFLMGIIYRSLYEMFCHPKSGEGGILIGLFIFTKLSIIEADFSIVFGNIAHYIVLLIIISRLMKGRGESSA